MDDRPDETPPHRWSQAVYYPLMAVMLSAFVLSALGIAGILVQLFFVVLIVGSLASVRGHPRLFAIGILLALPAVLLTLLERGGPGPWLLGARAGVLIFLAAVVLRDVYQTKVVTGGTVCGALFVYLLLGVVWGELYCLTEILSPGSFAGLAAVSEPGDFTYYSYVTLTTLGYGDVTPVSEPARNLAVLEAVVGQLYLVAAVARLVGLMSVGPR